MSRKVARPSTYDRSCRVVLFAPSSPIEIEKLEAGLKMIKEKIPWVEITVDVFLDQIQGVSRLPYLAGEDRLQAERFTGLMLKSSYDIIWGVRGGYGSSRWLDMVPWDRIGHEAPVLIGFSDVSCLHCALVQKGLLSIHGPLISTLPITSEPAKKALWKCLSHGEFPSLSGRPLIPGEAMGTLVGGNLSCITHMIGTAFEPSWDGAILLIEDQNESLYRLDRMLTQLLLTGRLSGLAGIAVGQLLGVHESGTMLQTLLEDRLTNLGVPVITDLPVGHGPDNYPLLIGGEYLLEGDKGLLRPMRGLPLFEHPGTDASIRP